MDIQTILRDMRRPKLLIRAARISLDLKDCEHPAQCPREPLARLVDREAALEDMRRTGRSGYNARAHVSVLADILAQARNAPLNQA